MAATEAQVQTDLRVGLRQYLQDMEGAEEAATLHMALEALAHTVAVQVTQQVQTTVQQEQPIQAAVVAEEAIPELLELGRTVAQVS
jgi:DNA-binding protein Fis